jgi:hypothetical protein
VESSSTVLHATTGSDVGIDFKSLAARRRDIESRCVVLKDLRVGLIFIDLVVVCATEGNAGFRSRKCLGQSNTSAVASGNLFRIVTGPSGDRFSISPVVFQILYGSVSVGWNESELVAFSESSNHTLRRRIGTVVRVQ